MATRIQLRRGTSAQWTAANPILASGEVGIELDTFQWKVGDGTTAWNSRPYVASGTVTLPEGGDLDDVPDGVLYKKIQAAFATAINGETFDAASVLNAGIGGVAKSVLGSAIDDIAISGIFVMYDEALGPFPGYTTVIISSVADGTSKLQVAFRQSTTLPQMAVRVMVDSTWYSWVMFDNVQAALYAGADKTTLVDADVFTILDSEASNVIKKFTWANLKAKVLAAFGVQVAALTAKSPPADADLVAVADSAASNASRKVTFTSIWTWIQSKINAASNKDALVDADKFAIVDTEASNVTKTTTWANIKAKIWAALGGLISGGTGKTTAVDGDMVAIADSGAANATKKLTLANLAAYLWTKLGSLIAGGTDKATPVDADTLALSDSAASNASRKVTFTSIWTWIQSKYAGVTAKAAPVDADTIAFTDTEASNVAKKLTFANLWTWVQGKIHGAANKAAIVDADKFAIVDTEASNATKTTTWSNIKAKIWAALGALTAGGTDKATPVDADTLPLSDSEAANATKKLTFANLKVWVLSAIGKANAATGFTLAGGTTSKTFTVDVDAKTSDIPTTAGKTAADAIGAASGADTKEKIVSVLGETAPGRALVEAANAAAQRSALGLGDSATKNVGTGAGDVAAGNAPAAAQAAAEATAAGALAGHVAAADPHTQYALEADMTPALAAKADLVDGKVPSTQLPAYVDDVLEYANHAAFPATGEAGKIYVALDTNLTYRWSGSAYVEISKSLALGETSSTAYRGDRGKELYDMKGQIPTADEKTSLSDIQAASGATTALKLANLTENATTTQKGVAEFATAAEIITGTDATRAVSVKELQDSGRLPTAAGKTAADGLGTAGIIGVATRGVEDSKKLIPATGADVAALLATGGYFSGFDGLSWDESDDSYTRFGRAATDPNYLKVQKGMRRCVLRANGTVAYYLCPTNSALKEDGATASVLDGTDGQVMVEIPKFYYSHTYVGTLHTWKVSEHPLPGLNLHPLFLSDTTELSKAYVGAFEAVLYDVSLSKYVSGNGIEASAAEFSDVDNSITCAGRTAPFENVTVGQEITINGTVSNNGTKVVATVESAQKITVTTALVTESAASCTIDTTKDTTNDKLGSVIGFSPITKITRAHARRMASNVGTGWTQETFDMASAVQLLYLIEYGTFYAQDPAGPNLPGLTGVSGWATYNNNYPIAKTGNSVSVGNATANTAAASGSPAATEKSKYLTYRGIENPFGHIWKWIDGFNVDNRAGYVCNNSANFADGTSTNYTLVGTMPSVDGFQNTLLNTNRGFLPATVGSPGDSNDQITDYYYQSSACRVAKLGGDSSNGGSAGFFCWALNDYTATSYRFIGARLQYRK